MAISAGEPGEPVIILAATVVTVLGILVEPRLEFTGFKAFFRFPPETVDVEVISSFAGIKGWDTP